LIEGTQSSLSDLLLFEPDMTPGVPTDDVREVCNDVAVLNHDLARLAEGFPRSLRLIKEMHSILLAEGLGVIRRRANFADLKIGAAAPARQRGLCSPPDEQVMECMGKLELFLRDHPETTPALLKAAPAHVQFETIHSFLDGNGRLLITLLLCERKVLREPLL